MRGNISISFTDDLNNASGYASYEGDNVTRSDTFSGDIFDVSWSTRNFILEAYEEDHPELQGEEENMDDFEEGTYDDEDEEEDDDVLIFYEPDEIPF